MSPQRQSADKLLKRIQKDSLVEKRGKLKIYLGAAPGVGKTYSMLQDGMAQRKQGLDVIIGIVETHNRLDTQSLIMDFEILSRQSVEYRGKTIEEFDLDAAVKRNPGLILIDEMAHTNAPGLRHAKRWQDIKEMLDRGTDVYTTLNVQHIESLNDIIAQITHTRVKETIPDSMLEMANFIELVDLPPEELLKRLEEGKVYFPEQAELAAEHFFRKANLTALRELALRITAERVGAQVLSYRQDQEIKQVWATKKKILVCIGADEQSLKLIRTARRLATSLKTEWTVIHVNAPKLKLSESERNQAIHNLRLAEQLGAETRTLAGFDVVGEIINFAQEHNVTQIVIGKKIKSRFRSLFSRSLTDEIVRSSGEIDVYIVTGLYEKPKLAPTSLPPSEKKQVPWSTYLNAILIVMLATFINYLLFPILKDANLIMIYMLSITIVALFGKTGPSLLASILSVVAFDFCFIPPYFTFSIRNMQYFFTLTVMMLITQIISHLTILTRQQAEIAKLAEQHTAALHNLSRQLASTRGVNKLLETAIQYIGEVFDSQVVALLPNNKHLEIAAKFRTETVLSPKEQGVAQWVYEVGQVAGLGTDTLPNSDAIYVPLRATQGPIGVISVHPMLQNQLFSPEQMRLLEGCANQISLALEVDRLQEHSKKTELQSEINKVRSVLLESISYHLRLPLVAIIDSAKNLISQDEGVDEQSIKKMAKNIYIKLKKLNKLITNLLQITSLEAETTRLQKEMCSLHEITNLVAQKLKRKLKSRTLVIHVPNSLPSVPIDKLLLQEVFINLIDNAIKFTKINKSIEIFGFSEKDKILVSIEDHGSGLDVSEINKYFERNSRIGSFSKSRGLGIGLAICSSIIHAHGGEIWAESHNDGGTIICFTLPMK